MKEGFYVDPLTRDYHISNVEKLEQAYSKSKDSILTAWPDGGLLYIGPSTLRNHLAHIYYELEIGASRGISLTRLAVWTLREISA